MGMVEWAQILFSHFIFILRLWQWDDAQSKNIKKCWVSFYLIKIANGIMRRLDLRLKIFIFRLSITRSVQCVSNITPQNTFDCLHTCKYLMMTQSFCFYWWHMYSTSTNYTIIWNFSNQNYRLMSADKSEMGIFIDTFDLTKHRNEICSNTNKTHGKARAESF